MNWMMLYLTFSDNVCFITDQAQTPSYLFYDEFIQKISPLKIKNLSGLIKQIDCFDTIFVDFSSGEWRVYEQESKEATFEELYELNKPPESDEEEESMIQKSHRWMQEFVRKVQDDRQRKNDFSKRFTNRAFSRDKL